MIKNFFRVLFALMLVLGVSIVTAVPVFAAATGHIADNDLTAQVIGMAKTKCVQKVTITNPGGAGNLNIDSFAVTNTGTAVDADVTQVAVYHDTNGTTGSWDGSDALIGSAANFSGAGAIGGDDGAACLIVAAGATEVVFVVVTTALAPTDGFTFQTTIDGSDLTGVGDTWDGTLGIATATSATTIDAVAPTATVTTTVDPIYEGALVQTVIVTYDESMDPATTPVITLTGANWGSQAAGAWDTAAFANDRYTTTFTHDGTQEEMAAEVATVASGSGATDVAGNADVGDASPPFVVDTQKPTVAITSTASPGPTYTSPIPMTATFSEDVTGFVLGDITVGNGAAGNFNPVSGTVYTFNVIPAAQGTVTVDIAAGVAQDAATNNNTAAPQFSITYMVTVVGGPPVPGPQPGVTPVSDFIRPDGVFTDDVTASSDDGKGDLIIEKGTKGLTKGGLRLSHIDFTTVSEGEEPSVGAGVQFAGNAYELGPPGATFEPAITIAFTLDASVVPVDTPQFISYFDPDTEAWVDLDTTVTFDPATNTYSFTAEVSHFTCFAVLAHEIEAPPAAAIFELGLLSISPAEIEIGEEVIISVMVTNTGGQSGSYKVTLKNNDVVVDAKEVTLAAGSSEKVIFTTSRDVAGSYSVDINGLTGSFTVKAPPELAPSPAPPAPAPPAPAPLVPPAKPINWPVLGAIIAGVVIAGLSIFFIVRRRAY